MLVNHDYVLKDKGASNTFGSSLLPRYRWYEYKEGFSPILLEHAVQGVTNFNPKEDFIFDPFNGGGTVTLFSSINGYNAVGCEVNPFSAFIASTKEISLNKNEVDSFKIQRDKLLKYCNKLKKSPLENFSTFSEKEGLDKWLFNTSVLESFESGKTYLQSINAHKVRSLLKLALIASAMENCNAKKDGKCLRYKKKWQSINYNKDSLIQSFVNTTETYLEDIQSTHTKCTSKILISDARQFNSKHVDKYKLCITSPPYLNSFDYTDIYRPELFLGEFINSQKQLLHLRAKTLRSHTNHRSTFDSCKTFGITYDKTIDLITKNNFSSWQTKIPAMVQSYFEDMKKIFLKLRTQAKENAHLWLIVANSAYADYEIPTDLILAEIGGQTRWFLQEIGVLRYLHKRGSIYSPHVSNLRESVIIFSTSPKM